MRVYALIDTREVNQYESMQLFFYKSDAENQRQSMGDSDYSFFHIHEIEVIE
jgi:hypothetical protein